MICKGKKEKRICRLEGRAEEMVVVEYQEKIFKREGVLPSKHVLGRTTDIHQGWTTSSDLFQTESIPV